MASAADGLKNKTVIVTGAGRGIGKSTALRLGGAGCRIAVADIDEESGRRTLKEIEARKGQSVFLPVDVSDEDSVLNMAERTHEIFGSIDILVNNAGILFRTRFEKISLAEWEDVIRVNLTGPYLCTRAVLPEMKKRKWGRIINISSSAGRSVSTLGGAHYTASKAGLLGLTRAVAKEVAAFGITVNAVCPGLIDTDMARSTAGAAEIADYERAFPIPRLGQPDEVGDLVVFLCSEKAAYITGASIDINGGDLMV